MIKNPGFTTPPLKTAMKEQIVTLVETLIEERLEALGLLPTPPAASPATTAEPEDDSQAEEELEEDAVFAFPIAGYDAMNAEQAKKALEGLDRAELGFVKAHEKAHKNRKTVLRAAADRVADLMWV